MADEDNPELFEEKATLTIRLIKSFEYRNVKLLIQKNVNLKEITTEKLLEMIKQGWFDLFFSYLMKKEFKFSSESRVEIEQNN